MPRAVPLKIRPGKTARVVLQEFSSSGYLWDTQGCPDGIRISKVDGCPQIDGEDEGMAGKTIGASIDVIFDITLLNPRATFDFRMRQPWVECTPEVDPKISISADTSQHQ